MTVSITVTVLVSPAQAIANNSVKGIANKKTSPDFRGDIRMIIDPYK
jgi:hypothetical protein